MYKVALHEWMLAIYAGASDNVDSMGTGIGVEISHGRMRFGHAMNRI